MFEIKFSRFVIISGGFVGVILLLIAPFAFFVSGNNDSVASMAGFAALALSMLPACILALYRRVWAGVWLIIVGSYAATAAAWNQYHVLVQRGIPVDTGEVIGSGFFGILAALFGLFFLYTGVRGWPEIRGPHSKTR